mmetsp:Transcript_12370/g.25558  ORF Transcript_12370/g.25558 Transcript_12370/m.25558 type:complete len:192 (+) Transcript_12370:10-585(+)
MVTGISASVRYLPHRNTIMYRILFGMIIVSLTGLLAGVESFSPTRPSPLTRTTIRSTNHIYQRQRWQQSSLVILRSSEDDADTSSISVLNSIGLVSQPIVWVSLYSLATTGHGLPAGPGGAIGAVEGIAYLVVLVLSILPTTESSLARTLSRASIALGLLVLAGVAAGKGCVPNAKPILDYSAYLPVCGPE